MSTSARGIVGWTDQRWQAVQEAVEKAIATTAKCRQVVPIAPEQLGEKAVVVARINPGAAIGYAPDEIASPIQIFVDVTLDDQHAQTDAEIIRLVETGAAQLGVLEDQEIIQGAPAAPPPAARGAAPAVPRAGRNARNAALNRSAARNAGVAGPVAITAAGGADPTSAELYAAIAKAVARLEGAGRPGRYGLLVANSLMAILRQPRAGSAVPLIQEVEGLIGSSEIAGTSALDGTFAAGQIGAILFRLEPAAMDLVHTQRPTVSVLSRAAGATDLRIEEEIVLRVLDPEAIQSIAY